MKTSFHEPQHHELLSLLQNKNDYKNKSPVNLLRSLTIGYRMILSQISGSIQFRNQTVISRSFTDLNGKLSSEDTIPLLAKRYSLLRIINEGTFCQVFSATDTWIRKSTTELVAIKVMGLKFSNMGVRESSFLRFLSRAAREGSMYCEFQ